MAAASWSGVATGPHGKLTCARIPGEEQPALAHRMPRHVVEDDTADLVRSAPRELALDLDLRAGRC
jgi:hypothetical protein